MNHVRPILTSLLVAGLLAIAAAPAAAQGPDFEEREDKFVLKNDDVTVWFHGKKPMLHVFPTEGNESDGYGYHFKSLVEYRDLDGDGAVDDNEVLSRLQLNRAKDWQVERVDTDTEVLLNLTLNDSVRLRTPLEDSNLTLPTDRTAQVSLVFHLRDASTTLLVDNVSVDVPATAIKYDLLVAQWPWIDAENGRLALQMDITGTLANATLDAEAIGAATVEANGTSVGALTWLTTAEATTADGENLTVPVNATIDELEEGNATRLTFTYEAAGYATLLHDPTIGTASAGDADAIDGSGGIPDALKDVPAPGVLALVAAVGTVAALGASRLRARRD